MTTTRLLALDDAPILADLVSRNREFLGPWEPLRDEEYFTVDGQRAAIRDVLDQHERGAALPHLILGDSGDVLGRITLSGIVRGSFQSGCLGYWVSADSNGRGVATAAVREMVRLAFEDLGLHRVQAETLRHNVRSQRVLERNGFTRYGMAPAYLKIAGRWQDNDMYQVIQPS